MGTSTKLTSESIAHSAPGLIAILLGVVTEGFSYSFWWKLSSAVAACVLSGIWLWKWQQLRSWLRKRRRLKNSSVVLRIGFSCLTALGFLALMLRPLRSQFNSQFDIKLDFKAAPQFTNWMQIRTRYDLSRFRDHLREIGLNTPDEIAPLEVGGEKGSVEPSISADKPLYESAIRIGKNKIKDRKAVTEAYLMYVDMRLGFSDKESLGQIYNATTTRLMIQPCINASYWNISSAMAKRLGFWDIRNKFGQDFADRLAVRTLVVARSDSDLDTDSPFAFLCASVKEADGSIDSDSARWPQIAGMMRFPENCANPH